MALLLLFALTLLAAVLVSGLAARSVLSTAVVFLVVGFLAGRGVLGVVHVTPRQPVVVGLAELALYSILFTDGMHAGLADLRAAWRLPGRALLFGMPLTFGGSALLAHYLVGLSWVPAMLVAAILAPTDPVFAAAIVGRDEVPRRLRHLLNVESGLNDGLALPVVLVLLSLVSAHGSSTPKVLGELALGVAVGVVLPWVALRVEALPAFRATGRYQPLNAFAIGLVVLAVCKVTHANEFLAAFAAGSTVASSGPEARTSFQRFGELVAELFKLAAILVFGALLTPALFSDTPLRSWSFALLLLLVVRPLAIGVALAGGGLPGRELAAAAWFGPKGFASVTYALYVLQAQASQANRLFDLVAVAVAVSIVLHSSTDVPVARWFVPTVGDPRPRRRRRRRRREVPTSRP